jgi:hypothetical protein
MGIPVVQVADAETNTVFGTLRGVISLQVTRGGYSSPGMLEMTVTADVDADAKAPYNPPGFDSGADALTLGPGENGAFWMAVDENSGLAYVTTSTGLGPPGTVVKVRLNQAGPPTRVAAVQLTDPAEQGFRSITVDGNGQYVYAVTASNPARVVKIRASDMARVAHATVSALAGGGGPSIASSAGDRLYVATDTRLVQFDVNGAGITETGAILLNAGWGEITAMRGLGQTIYAVGNREGGAIAITKFGLSAGAGSPSFVGTAPFDALKYAYSIDLLTDGTGYVACNFSPNGPGPATLVKFDIGGTLPAKVAELQLPAIDRGIFSIDADPSSGYLYALHTSPMKLVKVDTAGSMSKVSTTNAPSGFDKGRALALHGGAAYGTTNQYPAAVVKFELSKSGAAPAPGSLNRWYPFIKLRVVELDDQESVPGLNTRQYFIGRLDEAKLVEDEQMGRVWKVTARDWLGALADNYVDKGKWFTMPPHRGLDVSLVGKPWDPVYVGNWSKGPSGVFGERRMSIISDLALNVIASAGTGLWGVIIDQAPNSRRIQADWRGTKQSSILDAIRELSMSDPWFVSSSGANIGPLDGEEKSVDALWLYQNNFPKGSGFGGEFQIICDTVGNNGQVAAYFRRGSLSSNKFFSYGPFPGSAVTDGSDVNYIIEHSFDKQGFDIFSRSRVQGKGEAASDNSKQNEQDNLTGTAIVVKEMEEEWDPTNGRFRVRRESPNRDQGRAGEWEYSTKEDGNDATTARSLRDSAYASLVSGHDGLENTRGGLNRGSVTVADLPNLPWGGVVSPGTLCGLYIPHAGIVDPGQASQAKEFVIDGWTFQWPETITTYTLARQSYSSIGQQLLRMARMAAQGMAGLNDSYATSWFPVNGDGQMNIEHKLGVKPSRVTIEVGLWDGGSTDPNGQPVPILGTTVQVQGHHWDPAEGQHVGASVTKVAADYVGLSFAYHIAYSDGAGMWLTTANLNTLTRFRVFP